MNLSPLTVTALCALGAFDAGVSAEWLRCAVYVVLAVVSLAVFLWCTTSRPTPLWGTAAPAPEGRGDDGPATTTTTTHPSPIPAYLSEPPFPPPPSPSPHSGLCEVRRALGTTTVGATSLRANAPQ